MNQAATFLQHCRWHQHALQQQQHQHSKIFKKRIWQPACTWRLSVHDREFLPDPVWRVLDPLHLLHP